MKLGKYKGLTAKQPSVDVSRKEILSRLRQICRDNMTYATVDDRPSREGDCVRFSVQASMDGKPVPAFTHKRLYLTIGENAWIPGFDALLTGKMAGDTVSSRIRIPETAKKEEYRGKEIDVKVQIQKNGIREIPPLDDELALDHSIYATLDEWIDSLKETMLAERRERAQEDVSRQLLDQIIADSEFEENEDLVAEIADMLYEEFLGTAAGYHMTPEEYCAAMGRSLEEHRRRQYTEARRMIQTQAVLHGIAEQEHLKPAEEDFWNELLNMAFEEGYFDEEDPSDISEEELIAYRDELDEEELQSVQDDLLLDAAMQFVLEHARIREE